VGTIRYERDGAVEASADLSRRDYTRHRENLRNALYQEVPGFESIQTIADLERLCALAARNRAVEPSRYQDLVEPLYSGVPAYHATVDYCLRLSPVILPCCLDQAKSGQNQ
jgi:hypothetical protein